MMKRMRKWAAAGLAVGSGLILVMGEQGAAQERVPDALACSSGMEEGDLGISGLDCVGECTLSIKGDGRERSWFFSTEPRILGVDAGGPADGVLRAGDYLVAIDGILITTKGGGDRFGNLSSGERVTVRFRRDGRVGEATVQVGTRCREMPNVVGEISRVPPPPPPEPDAPRRSLGVAVSPRVRVAPERVTTRAEVVAEVRSTISRRATTGLLAGMSPTGRLGIGFSCTECGTQTNEETGENVWFFSGPLEVTAVNVGGPADGAGIQRGDLIKAIAGHALDTEEGGLAFTRITPGKSVHLTLVKRNGSEVEVSLVPEEAVAVPVAGLRNTGSRDAPVASRVTARAAEPVRRTDVAPLPPSAVPDVDAVPSPPALVTAPDGMPLRYSGAVNGVEVEVRGNPVTVSEMRGARTILINAEGLWIRITVPRGGEPPDREAVRIEPLIRR